MEAALCDLSNLQTLLGIATGLITAAIALAVVALGLNAGICTAPGAVPVMISAGITTLAVVGALAPAISMIENYYKCMGSPEECLGEMNNLLNSIRALITVLSIQATACFVAAGIAWIPWAGGVPIGAIIAALTVQLGLIPAATIFYFDFVDCVQNAQTPAIVGWVTGALVVAAIGIIMILIPVRKKIKESMLVSVRRKSKKKDQ